MVLMFSSKYINTINLVQELMCSIQFQFILIFLGAFKMAKIPKDWYYQRVYSEVVWEYQRRYNQRDR
jgi:hypothetical protein